MELILTNISGKTRRLRLNGREYIVAPMASLRQGVLNGSAGALYYPGDEIKRDPSIWNGMPLTNGHPVHNGQNVSARSPEMEEKHWIGKVYNSSYAGDTLQHEGWFDVELTKAKDKEFGTDIYNRLDRGESIELSTGLFTDNVDAVANSNYGGKPYQYIAKNYRADHVAILANQRGACSREDGCGVLLNKKCDACGRVPETNANPEGHNQYSGGDSWSPESVKASKGAVKASLNTSPDLTGANQGLTHAKNAAKASTSAEAAQHHDAATKAHEDSANNLYGEGQRSRGDSHYKAAEAHRVAAAEHRKSTNNAEPTSDDRNVFRKVWNWLVGNDNQPRHPVDGTYQGKTRLAAKKGFENTGEPDTSGAPLFDEDQQVGQGDRPADEGKLAQQGDKPILPVPPVSEDPDDIEGTYNRDWSAEKRDKLPEDDFAGPGQSFPIQKQSDVDAAAHLVGKADNPDAVKSRIIAIAKRKGLTVPDAWTSSTTNSYEESDMPKADTITYLTANCDCWKGQEKVLNTMDETQLNKLKTNHDKAKADALVANALTKPVKIGDKETTLTFNAESGELVANDAMQCGEAETGTDTTGVPAKKKAPVPPAPVAPAANQVELESALAKSWGFNSIGQMKATLNMAKQVVEDHKSRVASQLKLLIANENHPSRKQILQSALDGGIIDNMQNAVILATPSQGDVQPQPNASPFTNYLGAAPGVVNARAENDNKDDILPMPTYNWGQKESA